MILESTRKETRKLSPEPLCMLLHGEVFRLPALFADELHDLAGFVKTKRIHPISNLGSTDFWLYQSKSRIAELVLAALLWI